MEAPGGGDDFAEEVGQKNVFYMPPWLQINYYETKMRGHVFQLQCVIINKSDEILASWW